MSMALDKIPLEASGRENLKDFHSDDLILLETTRVTEEDAAQFPGELVLEHHIEPAPEARQHQSEWVGKLSIPQKIRLAMLGNQEARGLLIRDPNKIIPLAVLRNPKISETEVILYAQMRTVPEDVFWAMSKHKTWIKNYLLKATLVSNPKTPLSLAIKLLDYLHDRDLQNLSRSKNVSSVLARSAARLLYKRRG